MNHRKLGLCRSMAGVVIATALLCGNVCAQTLTVLHNFGGPGMNGTLDGANPYAGMTFDTQGNLYGTAARGGQLFCLLDGCGIVYELKPGQGGTWNEQVLSLFGNGGTPVAPVALDRSGNVYGTFACTQDCFNNNGGVFELVRGGNGTWTTLTLTNPQSFTGCGNGICAVAFDGAGNLYGTTQQVQNSNNGEAFSLSHPSIAHWIALVLHAFNGQSDGGSPSIYFTFDAAGNMYGTNSSGGAFGRGTAFKLIRNPHSIGWPEMVLYSFAGGTDGDTPNGGMIFDAAGNLYGTTVNGGTAGTGTVFKLTPQPNGSWSESILYSFQGENDASHPAGPLTLDAAGNLYGVAGGGVHGHGAVFKLVPAQDEWSESLYYSFTGGLDGDTPSGGVIFDSAGNLYGTTVYGGAYPTCSDEPYCGGVAYKIAP